MRPLENDIESHFHIIRDFLKIRWDDFEDLFTSPALNKSKYRNIDQILKKIKTFFCENTFLQFLDIVLKKSSKKKQFGSKK